MLKNKKGLLAAILGCLFLSLGAQNTNSPYSRYGYGILKDNSIGASRSMGGISYGLRNSQSANPGNPASYSGVDSLTFIFDIGISYSKAQLSDDANTQREDNGGLDYITMVMPLSKRVGLSFGILPYSSVGYSFGSQEAAGSTSYVKSFSGSGGTSQVYAGLAYEPIKNLSVGANVYYMFGSILHTSSIPSTNAPGAYTEASEKTLTINTFRTDLGVQYSHPINSDNLLTLGAVFSPKMNSRAKYENYHRQLSTSAVVNEDTTSLRMDAGYPNTYGIGFTVAHKKNLTVGADLTYQEWSKVKYSNIKDLVGDDSRDEGDGMTSSDRFNNRWKVNAGVEYVTDPMARSFFKRMKFRGGLNYSNSYLNVKNTTGSVGGYKEYGATLGLGLPVRDSYTGRTSYVNIGFEYLTVRPEMSNMIKETYLGVTLNVNINDFWFMKNKFK